MSHEFDGGSPSGHDDAYELDMDAMMNSEYVFDKAEDEAQEAADEGQHELEGDVAHEFNEPDDAKLGPSIDEGSAAPKDDAAVLEPSNVEEADHGLNEQTQEPPIVEEKEESEPAPWTQPEPTESQSPKIEEPEQEARGDAMDEDRQEPVVEQQPSPVVPNHEGPEPEPEPELERELERASQGQDQSETQDQDQEQQQVEQPEQNEQPEEPAEALFKEPAPTESAEGVANGVASPGPGPEVAEQSTTQEKPGSEEEEAKSHEQPDEDMKEAEPAPVHLLKDDQEQQKAPIPQQPEFLPQQHTIVIPSYAMWFSMNKISDIESKSLPEFFNGKNKSKTPQIYKQYRDFMINTYRLNPQEYLTLTACRRHLVGDVGALLRLHQFLEKWGLINYQVDVESRPMNVAPPFTGHWQPLLDTPRGLFPFQFYKGTQDPSAMMDNQMAGSGPVRGNNIQQEDDHGSQPGRKRARANENDNANDDDTRMDVDNDVEVEDEQDESQLRKDKRSSWSKKELLDLLDAVEKSPHDWNQIAQSVGTKTRHECILKFLTLSIEDSYLEKEDSKVNGKLGPLKYDISQIPFSQADNPVMSVLAFLTGLVDPKVTAKAAGKSLDELRAQIESKEDTSDKADTNGHAQDDSNKDTPGQLLPGDVPPLGPAATMAFAISGARSGVLATDVERQMYSNFLTIASKQAEKVDRKLLLFHNLERVMEIERRELEKEKEQVFLDRLALHRKVRAVDALLSKAISDAESPENRDQVQATLQEARDVVTSGTSLSLEKVAHDEEVDGGADKTNEDVRPISVELPQTYRFWSG